MTYELFDAAYGLTFKIKELEIMKQRIQHANVISIDTLPFTMHSAYAAEMVEAMKGKVEELSKQAKQEFITEVDKQIDQLKEEFKAL